MIKPKVKKLEFFILLKSQYFSNMAVGFCPQAAVAGSI